MVAVTCDHQKNTYMFHPYKPIYGKVSTQNVFSTNPRFTNRIVCWLDVSYNKLGATSVGPRPHHIWKKKLFDLGMAFRCWPINPTPSRSPAQFRLPRAVTVCETMA